MFVTRAPPSPAKDQQAALLEVIHGKTAMHALSNLTSTVTSDDELWNFESEGRGAQILHNTTVHSEDLLTGRQRLLIVDRRRGQNVTLLLGGQVRVLQHLGTGLLSPPTWDLRF